VLLTASQERVLFLQFNYCRYRVCKLRDKLRGAGDGFDADMAVELLAWHRRAEQLRDQIAQTNLALVLAMGKRTRMSEVDFGDLVSEGNMALLRAIDKFDVARGFKFSTYACRAILKAFSRAGVKLSRYRGMFPTDFDPALERSDYAETRRAGIEDDCADEIKHIISENRAELSDVEQEVIEHRFAIGRKRLRDPASSPMTLEQVGRIIGVTKERVRQIQNKALEKIRQSLEGDYLG
jgi:RNA polymerase sigma factor (sigma-70 family)